MEQDFQVESRVSDHGKLWIIAKEVYPQNVKSWGFLLHGLCALYCYGCFCLDWLLVPMMNRVMLIGHCYCQSKIRA